MQYTEFFDKVRRSAKLQTLHDAEVITRASLATLGERLPESYVFSLGAQLSVELKRFLTERRREDRFSLEEYYNRVAARADIGYPEAVSRSIVVMAVLREAVGESVIGKTLEQLPAEYGELFGSTPFNPLSPSNPLGR